MTFANNIVNMVDPSGKFGQLGGLVLSNEANQRASLLNSSICSSQINFQQNDYCPSICDGIESNYWYNKCLRDCQIERFITGLFTRDSSSGEDAPVPPPNTTIPPTDTPISPTDIPSPPSIMDEVMEQCSYCARMGRFALDCYNGCQIRVCLTKDDAFSLIASYVGLLVGPIDEALGGSYAFGSCQYAMAQAVDDAANGRKSPEAASEDIVRGCVGVSSSLAGNIADALNVVQKVGDPCNVLIPDSILEQIQRGREP